MCAEPPEPEGADYREGEAAELLATVDAKVEEGQQHAPLDCTVRDFGC